MVLSNNSILFNKKSTFGDRSRRRSEGSFLISYNTEL